jgi:glycosyltransferase involved in cell wall biosynthesis
MEALAMECMVIGSDIRGTRDLLGAGYGMLYKLGDWRALAEVTCAVLMGTKPAAVSTASRGRDMIAQQYSTEAVRKALEQVYSEVLRRFV